MILIHVLGYSKYTYTITCNKIAVSNGDDNEIQDEERITTYTHG